MSFPARQESRHMLRASHHRYSVIYTQYNQALLGCAHLSLFFLWKSHTFIHDMPYNIQKITLKNSSLQVHTGKYVTVQYLYLVPICPQISHGFFWFGLNSSLMIVK